VYKVQKKIQMIVASTVLFFLGCQNKDHENYELVHTLLKTLQNAFDKRDCGAIMEVVEYGYADDHGNVRQLEKDVRQLFVVYGQLSLSIANVVDCSHVLKSHVIVQGRGLHFEGPMVLEYKIRPNGIFIQSGLLTDLRGVQSMLRERRVAYEQGEVNRLDKIISMNYQGEGGTREKLLCKLRSKFAQISNSAMIIDDVNIFVEHTRAVVAQSYLLITNIEQRRYERRARERLVLTKEGTRWRIIKGLG
jgi:hypothetical protein